MALANLSVGYGHNISTSNNLEKSLDLVSSNGLHAFYDWYDLSFGVEFNYFYTSQRNHELITMSKNYYDALAWARYNFINKDTFKLHFALGAGGFQEEVKFYVADEKLNDTSEPHWLVPVAFGGSYKIFRKFLLGAEYRLTRRVESELNLYSVRASLSYLF